MDALQTLGIIYNQLETNDKKKSGNFNHYNYQSEKSTPKSLLKSEQFAMKKSTEQSTKLDLEKKGENNSN